MRSLPANEYSAAESSPLQFPSTPVLFPHQSKRSVFEFLHWYRGCHSTAVTLNADYAADLPGMDGYREYIYLLINNELFTQNSDWKAYAGCEITDSDPMPEYSIDYIRLYQDIQNESVLTVK